MKEIIIFIGDKREDGSILVSSPQIPFFHVTVYSKDTHWFDSVEPFVIKMFKKNFGLDIFFEILWDEDDMIDDFLPFNSCIVTQVLNTDMDAE